MAAYYAHLDALFFLAIFFPVLSIIAVVLRFYVRRKAGLGWWVDDWLLVPALAIQWGLSGLVIWGVTTNALGGLLPPPSVPGPKGFFYSISDEQIRLVKIKVMFDDLSVWLFGLVKLSILFFLRRIFCGKGIVNGKFNIATKASIGLVILWTLVFGLALILDCKGHPSDAWRPLYQVVKDCPNVNPLLLAFTITDFVLDVIIWSLPIPKIWVLRLPVRRKLAVASVFLIGLLTIGASAARLAVPVEYTIDSYSKPNGEEIISYLAFWYMIEIGLSIIVACMPTYHFLFRKIDLSKLVQKIKSTISLRSLRSRGERSSHSGEADPERAKTESSVPQPRSNDRDTTSKYVMESFEMETVDSAASVSNFRSAP